MEQSKNTSKEIPQVYYIPQETPPDKRENKGQTILSNRGISGDWTENLNKILDTRIQKRTGEERYNTSSVIFVSGNNVSKYQQLCEAFNQLDDGPYYPNGRDNKLTFQNTRTGDTIMLSYIYSGGNGELLDFEVDTEFVLGGAETSKSSDLDPDDKTVRTEVNQVISDNNSMYQDGKVNRFDPQGTIESLSILQGDIPNIPLRASSKSVLHEKHLDLVKAKNEMLTYQRKYSSESDAIKDLGTSYTITQSDWEQYMDQLKTKHEKIQNPQTEAELYQQLSEADQLPNYIIKREVTIETEEDPSMYVPQGRGAGSRTATGGYTYTEKDRKRDWKTGYSYLEKKAGQQVLYKHKGVKYGGYSPLDKVMVRKTVTVEIPINGAKVLSTYSRRSSKGTVNNMINSAQNKITASAKVIGNPSIESSMNIEIKNVSDRYSGVWYTKEVSHIIDSSGYHCDIEFVQKSVPISVSNIQSVIPTTRAYDTFHKLADSAKEALKNKTAMARPALKSELKKWAAQTQTPGNIFVVTNPKNPFEGEVFHAAEDMGGARKLGIIEVDPDKIETNNYGITEK